MHGVIYLPFVLSVLLVGLSPVARRRASPRAAAWSLVVAMVVLAGAVVASLALLAWPLWARIPVVAELGHWAPMAVSRRDPVPLGVSVAATVALVAQAVALVHRLWRLRAELVAGEAAARHAAPSHAGLGDVAVLDDPVPTAVAFRGRVVVSTGLLAVLDHDERLSVLAHERAHLRHRHGLFAAVGALASAVDPIVRPVGRELGFVLERWADEDAAARTGPGVTARAIARVALARLSVAGPGLMLGGGLGRHAAAVGVPARVAALLEGDGKRATARVVWAVALLAVAALVAVAWGTHDTERLFEALQAG